MPQDLLAALTELLGPAHVLTGADRAAYLSDWTGHYTADPLAVVRPADTAQVAATVRLAAAHGVPVVPVSGRTGLVGGAMTQGGLMLSVERLNRIRDIRPAARVAVVEAGVILSSLHDAAEAADLSFPLWFGARGSAMIGGALSTNAGGSNVLRYGSTRALCLGLEVVLADGRVLDLMSALHKDNSGYDLKDLFIGAEGTLGIITAAVVKLVPRPRAYATATLAARSLPDALTLLNRLQAASGGMVEAFEFMPDTYMRRLTEARPDVGEPFATRHALADGLLLGRLALAPLQGIAHEHFLGLAALASTLHGFSAHRTGFAQATAAFVLRAVGHAGGAVLLVARFHVGLRAGCGRPGRAGHQQCGGCQHRSQSRRDKPTGRGGNGRMDVRHGNSCWKRCRAPIGWRRARRRWPRMAIRCRAPHPHHTRSDIPGRCGNPRKRLQACCIQELRAMAHPQKSSPPQKIGNE